MKNLTISLMILMISLVSANNVFALSQGGIKAPLSTNMGTIDRVDHKRFILVIDDYQVPVAKNVKVHSEFVRDDYFSRVKKGMKIKFKLEKKDGISRVTEIWVQ